MQATQEDLQATSHAAAVKALEKRDARRRRLPLLPALIFTIIVTQIPFLMGIYYSLTDWTGSPSR